MRSKSFCNLSEVVVRPSDTLEDLKRKVKYAVIFGTAQATRTDFKYLNPTWKKNTEEEALLGVSLTGIMDHPILSGKMRNTPDSFCRFFGEEVVNVEPTVDGVLSYALNSLKIHSIEVNKEWAKYFGINEAAAITCTKPSGTVSQLVDSASGIHPRYSPYYIRTVRSDKKDPLAVFMKEVGFPVEDDVMKPDSGLVFSFPVRAPEGSVFRDDVTAIDQLELWKIYQLHWSEHKPSITVYVKPDEWLKVGAWVYENFDILSGVSFLPHSEHTYRQAPYQECTEEEYNDFLMKMPKDVDWTRLQEFEKEDTTVGMKEYSCTGNSCELT